MTVSVGPDLSGAVSAVVDLMTDACVITSKDGPNLGTVVDGLLVSGGGTVLYRGRCYVSRRAPAPTIQAAGGGQAGGQVQGISIPLATVDPDDGYLSDQMPGRGDTVLITASKRDDSLVGVKFAVQAVEEKTFAVKRTLACERLDWTGPIA